MAENLLCEEEGANSVEGKAQECMEMGLKAGRVCYCDAAWGSSRKALTTASIYAFKS